MNKQNINHHLPDEVLGAYSAGSLPEAYALVVATHVSLCDDCRAALDSFDAIGGAILEDQSLEEVTDAALAATLALIADAPVAEPVRRQSSSIFPAPLADYIGGGPESVQWRNVGGGVRQAVLKTSNEATARLLYIPAGKKVPDHGHKGLELTMVLQGAFSDQVSRFGRGDVEIANEDLHHDPVAEMGEDCICLAATDAPLVFKDLIPRLAQPFIRI